jgi:ABC-type uncharacterized transport system permease subunit
MKVSGNSILTHILILSFRLFPPVFVLVDSLFTFYIHTKNVKRFLLPCFILFCMGVGVFVCAHARVHSCIYGEGESEGVL